MSIKTKNEACFNKLKDFIKPLLNEENDDKKFYFESPDFSTKKDNDLYKISVYFLSKGDHAYQWLYRKLFNKDDPFAIKDNCEVMINLSSDDGVHWDFSLEYKGKNLVSIDEIKEKRYKQCWFDREAHKEAKRKRIMEKKRKVEKNL